MKERKINKKKEGKFKEILYAELMSFAVDHFKSYKFFFLTRKPFCIVRDDRKFAA